jgi:hypothetical protein
VPLGNGTNYLGTGQLLSGVARENFVLAVSGPCSSIEQGDLLLAATERNFNTANPPTGGAWAGCDGGPTEDNAYYDPEGYDYTVTVPEAWAGGPLNIQVFDAAYCQSNSTYDAVVGPSFTTTFDVLDPTAAVPTLASESFTLGDRCTSGTIWRQQWRTLHTVAEPVPGHTYVVRVASSGLWNNSTAQQGANGFSLRAGTGSSIAYCSADPTSVVAPYDAACVDVASSSWLSQYAQFNSGSVALYSGAMRVGSEHDGRALELELFDVGEGTIALEVLDPTGNPATFDWSVVDQSGSDVSPTGGWSGTSNLLDTRGNAAQEPCGRTGNLQRGTGRLSGSKYNDRLLSLRIQLPEDMEAAYGGQTQWRLRLTTCSGGVTTDRSTWRASIVD